MELLRKVVKGAIGAFVKPQYKIVVKGVENIPKNTGYIICANHIHALDPLTIGLAVPFKVNFMAKKELFKNPFLNLILSNSGVFPIDREKNDISAIKKSLSILKNGEPLLIFPEGTRNKSIVPLPVKGGVVIIGLKAKVPIVPVMVDSTYERFSEVIVEFLPPVSLEEYYDKKLTNDEMEAILQGIINGIYQRLELHKQKLLSESKDV